MASLIEPAVTGRRARVARVVVKPLVIAAAMGFPLVLSWQAYLRYHALKDAAPYLNDALANERFAFYNTTLRGQKEQKPRWKRVLDTVNGVAGEALGKIYVEQVFPADKIMDDDAIIAAKPFAGQYVIESYKKNELVSFKPNADYQFYATLLFIQQFLLK